MTSHDIIIIMETSEKFSTKLNKQVLMRLRAFAKRSNRRIALVVSEAIAEYLQRAEVRPAFRDAVKKVVKEHSALLKELAK